MFRKYLKDTGGNFAIMFAVLTSVILLCVGAAVDYNGMRSERSMYQRYADAAVLAAASSGETKRKDLRRIAQDVVNANNLTNAKLKVKVTKPKKGFVQVQVSGKYNTALMGMFGMANTDVTAQAGAPLATDQVIDLALVLDTTGSMSGAKITSLKAAAHALIDELEAADSPGIRISVIPFAQYVNVGLSRRAEPWLDVPSDSSTTSAEVCYMTKDVTSRSNCVTKTNPKRTCYNDGVPYQCGGGTSTSCDNTYGPEYQKCYIPTNTDTWHGCVGSRATPWNERARKGSVKVPGLMDIKCGQEILALTNNMGTVRSNIDTLPATGNTYIPAGLIWGWRALNSRQPLTEAATTKNKKGAKRVLVLMTDGANVSSANGAWHTGTDVNKANKVVKNLCQNIKSEKIEMYTVAYDFSGVNTLEVLKKCASKKDHYFEAKNAAELKAVFKNIAANLNNLRLSY